MNLISFSKIRLCDIKEDSILTKAIKKLLRNRFDDRFPISDDAICAALLDPGIKRLRVVEKFFKDRGASKVDFLAGMCAKHVPKFEEQPRALEVILIIICSN